MLYIAPTMKKNNDLHELRDPNPVAGVSGSGGGAYNPATATRAITYCENCYAGPATREATDAAGHSGRVCRRCHALPASALHLG